MRQRYLRQRLPWIGIEESDINRQGDPETVVFLAGDDGSLVGLHIKGLPNHVMLGIREDVDGHPISCAVTNELDIDTQLHCQSNPRRYDDGQEDGC